MKRLRKLLNVVVVVSLVLALLPLSGCGMEEESDAVVLRVSNWEEYIDEGDWGEDEVIDLDNGDIIGINSMVDDFEEWYYETYGQKVIVEYSTFGTNEELYNQITIGDVYDLVCPSEYMIIKMIREGMVVPYSEEFRDASNENNYYVRGVSPYIRDVFKNLEIDGESLDTYAAGYMWGTLGLVYNPEEISAEDASGWDLLVNKDYYKRVTIKDSVRDAYFAAIAMNCYDEITDPEFIARPDYNEALGVALNRTDAETVDAVQEILTDCKDNAYSFETDSGKADLVTGKVVANEQWSGDAVYTMDQADEDGVELAYSVPDEGSNLWFDGWVMLESGISEDARKLHAAESFVNFVSRPDNAVRNMYYIGYTSVISGGEDDTLFQYADWTYGVEEEDMDEACAYDISYFFEGTDGIIYTYEDQLTRQLYAQYPTLDVMNRCVVMECFPDEANSRINRMWTNVRCFDMSSIFTKD